MNTIHHASILGLRGNEQVEITADDPNGVVLSAWSEYADAYEGSADVHFDLAGVDRLIAELQETRARLSASIAAWRNSRPPTAEEVRDRGDCRYWRRDEESPVVVAAHLDVASDGEVFASCGGYLPRTPVTSMGGQWGPWLSLK